ncbi:MAG TPA: hypothetical protein ENK66_02675 [Arcobacter sp.]|nr:hypothetical protein [Arcobacter sp.]
MFKKLYFDPIINNSSGIFYRAGTSRLLNMAKNEKVKSRSIEATARLEAERYFYYKKAAFATKVLNGIKRTQADAELLSREATAIRSEMLLFLLADKSNQKISEKKKELLGN